MKSRLVLFRLIVGLWLSSTIGFYAADASADWIAFDPPPDDSADPALLDLRFLNERVAGEGGFIGTTNGHFIHSDNGEPVRFWAVNGPPSEVRDRAELRRVARHLAKRGVNMVRLHGPVFDRDGNVDPAKITRAIAVVEEMKTAGIYTHLSIYFPLWFTPRSDQPWLDGYDGNQHPFAALFFNPEFQAKYREWWTALLLTPSDTTGRRLIDEPALFGAEIQNEDSLFFWTFAANNLPDPQWRILERTFADWLTAKYGSLDKTLDTWKSSPLPRDLPADRRIAFRPLWNVFNEKTARDKDTAAFLLEVQTRFYSDTYAFLRQLGFKGLIHASNWATASPEIFGPLEKLSYTVGDFIDRHGYFGCNHKGDNAAWSIRNDHTYSDRSALRFDAEDRTQPRQFVHPVMDPHYDDKPSMISETTFTRPNRFRSEAPLYFATYGALQDTDAIVHFAFDGAGWHVKPGFWMQPWTLASPAMLGQFPAAALIYRRGLVKPGRLLAEVRLNRSDLANLQGTPLPQDASLDELRLADVPQGTKLQPGQRIDPLVHYAGRSSILFTDEPGTVQLEDLSSMIDHTAQTITSSTSELHLDYRRGLLTINADRAQGLSGALRGAGSIQLRNLTIQSELELGHIVAVSLDDLPLATSQYLLLQVMSEERTSGFATKPVDAHVNRIVDIGRNPWQVRTFNGTVCFNRPDAANLEVIALDPNGHPIRTVGTAHEINLQPDTFYYIIRPSSPHPS